MLKLYPLTTKQIAQSELAEIRPALWQEIATLPDDVRYGVYHYRNAGKESELDFSIALEKENGEQPIEIPELIFYEIFRGNISEIDSIWQMIERKEKQGLVRRAYGVDFEKHLPEGKVEIYISLVPHC